MSKYFLLALLLFLFGCTTDEPVYDNPYSCDDLNHQFNSTVTINGTIKGFKAIASVNSSDTTLSISLDRCEGKLHELFFRRLPILDGDYTVHGNWSDTATTIKSAYWTNNIDVIIDNYKPWDTDSATNKLIVDVDPSTSQVSIQFHGTYVNEREPYDTLHISEGTASIIWTN